MVDATDLGYLSSSSFRPASCGGWTAAVKHAAHLALRQPSVLCTAAGEGGGRRVTDSGRQQEREFTPSAGRALGGNRGSVVAMGQLRRHAGNLHGTATARGAVGRYVDCGLIAV